jgi:hypothetical protein
MYLHSVNWIIKLYSSISVTNASLTKRVIDQRTENCELEAHLQVHLHNIFPAPLRIEEQTG